MIFVLPRLPLTFLINYIESEYIWKSRFSPQFFFFFLHYAIADAKGVYPSYIFNYIQFFFLLSVRCSSEERKSETKKERNSNQDQECWNQKFNQKKKTIATNLNRLNEFYLTSIFLFAKLICAHIQMTLDTRWKIKKKIKTYAKSRINENIYIYMCL